MTPFLALEQDRVGGAAALRDIAVVDPHEIGAGKVAVADAQLDARDRRATRHRSGHGLDRMHLAEQRRGVAAFDPDQLFLPEVAAALVADEEEQAEDQEQVERERAAAQGGHRHTEEITLALAGRRAWPWSQSWAYLRRRRCRTSSAAVLTTNVKANSSSAARKSAR